MTAVSSRNSHFGLPWLGFLFAVTLLVRLDTLFLTSVDWDEGVYLLMADKLKHGIPPYTAVWDHKPPLIYFLYFVGQLFTGGILGVRVLAAFGVALAAWLSSQICAEFIQAPNSARWLPATLVILGFRFYTGESANTELFFAAFLAATAWFVIRASQLPSAQSRFWLIAAGVAAGGAFWIKFNTVIEVTLLVLASMLCTYGRTPWREQIRFLLLGLCGFLLISGLVLLPFVFWGFRPMLDAVLSANVRHVGARPSISATFSFFAQMADLTRLLWAIVVLDGVNLLRGVYSGHWRASSSQPNRALCYAWLLGAVLSALAPGQPYPHYVLEWVVPLSCVAVLALHQLFLRHLSASYHRQLLAAAVALAMFQEPVDWVRRCLTAVRNVARGRPTDNLQAVASYLSNLDPSGARSVFVLDAEPVLYHLLGVENPTRFAFPPFLLDPRFAHVAGIDGLAEIRRVLSSHPLYVLRRMVSDPKLAEQRRLVDADLTLDYRVLTTVGGLEILTRIPKGEQP